MEHHFKFNKYLFLSLIILGVFIILSIGIYAEKHGIKSNNSISNNLLIETDKSILLFFNKFHVYPLYQFMKFLTEYGRDYFWIFVLFVMFFFGGHGGKVTAVVIMVSFLIIIPTNIFIKDVINRDRPALYDDYFYKEYKSDKSYPSGHASIVTAGAVTAALFFRTTWRQKLISSLLVTEAGLVCFSRLYLGSHYPFDILGGILLGSGISLLAS